MTLSKIVATLSLLRIIVKVKKKIKIFFQFTCCVWRSQMILLMVDNISSMKGTASPICNVTKCRLHFRAILIKVSHAMS